MKKFLIILISLSLVGCKSEEEEYQAVMPEEQMVQIMKDFMLLEATFNTRLIRMSDKDERMESYSEEILEKHGVSKEDFDASYEYYVYHPVEFESMMQLVFEELNKMETEAAKYRKRPLQDSTEVEEEVIQEEK